MKFLIPVGGVVNREFGILSTYKHKGVPAGIVAGMDWAGDNSAFTDEFSPTMFFLWLWYMRKYRPTCLFVAVPDVVGAALKTLVRFFLFSIPVWLMGYPLALVAQDGLEYIPFWQYLPFRVLFVGGSTEWKESQAAIEVIKRAQKHDKKIHIGRVNWKKRYNKFAVLQGSNEFTCDGTRTRFDGVDKTLAAWEGYQAQQTLIEI